jgi:hypothetical protein
LRRRRDPADVDAGLNRKITRGVKKRETSEPQRRDAGAKCRRMDSRQKHAGMTFAMRNTQGQVEVKSKMRRKRFLD